MHVRMLFTLFTRFLPPLGELHFLRACIRNKEEHINFDFWLLLHPAEVEAVQKESPAGSANKLHMQNIWAVFRIAFYHILFFSCLLALAIQNLFY